MAEADEGGDTGAPKEHVETPGHLPAEPVAAEPVLPGTPVRPQSEWTASDARGPLIGAHGDPVDHEAPPEAEPTATSEPPAAAYSGAAAPAPAAHPSAAPAKRGSMWPVAFGLIVGAGLGAAVALWVYPAVQPPAATHDPQVAGLSAKVADLSAQVAALQSAPKADASGTSAAAIAAVDAKVAALQSTVDALPKSAATAQPTFDSGPLDQKIAALSASVEALKAQSAIVQATETKLNDVAASVADLQKKSDASATALQTVQDQQKALQDQQKSLEGKVGAPALAVVSDSLVQQIDEGQPYAMQTDALGSLGADPVKVALLKQNAQTGVPSAKLLASKFATLAEPILATEHKAPPNASFADRMKSGLSSLVSIRRADDVSGSDLSSRVGRIQAALVHDDIGDALATWALLPADAQAKSEAWAALAKTSAEAQAAARSLQSEAIAAMSGKKS